MHKVLLSVTGFAVFFLFSVTWQLEGQSGIQNMVVQFDVASALAESNKDNNKDSDNDKNKDSSKDSDNDKNKDSNKDSDNDKNKDSNKDSDNDKNKDSNNDSNDGSCVCPPGVNTCVCADGTSGTPGASGNGVPQRDSLRSIHGGS